MLQNKPYYWVTCDFPVVAEKRICGIDAQEGSDYSAWAEPSAAIDEAVSSEWLCDRDGRRHYCYRHPVVDENVPEEDRDPSYTPTEPYLLVDEDGQATLVLPEGMPT